MALNDNAQHNLLFVITSILFILYTTGFALPPKVVPNTIVIPAG